MKQSNYIRLALLFNDNKATTFNSNLRKMICLVLYDNFDKGGLSVLEIANELNSKYSLQFSDTEIIDAINDRADRNEIVLLGQKTAGIDRIYQITNKKYLNIKNQVDESYINSIAARFINEHKHEITEEKFIQLLYKFFYAVFNSNKEIMMSLFGKDNIKIDETLFNEFNLSEKEIINSFIYWDNAEKNKCVYNLISCCFDYCSMTIGNNQNGLKDILSNKRFYIDTNVIFRMMGLNNANRKAVIDAFINKCKEMRIKLCYTNFTKKEFNETVDYIVESIKNKLSGSFPVSSKAVCALNLDVNLDFYNEYVNWANNNKTQFNNFSLFKEYLKKNSLKYLSSFDFCSFEDYEQNDSDQFKKYFDSLKTFKINNRVKIYEPSVKIDINNYMYIQESNSKTTSQDFMSIQNYMISTDHHFSNWDRNIRPSSIPIVVLPSVWYSIMLKYSGRSDDDYTAFTRFLNFTLTDETSSSNQIKEQIFESVMKLDESNEIKEEIIFDISEKLLTDSSDIDVDEVVASSHEYITNKKINDALKDKEHELNYLHSNEIESIKNSTRKDIENAITNERNKQIERETKECASRTRKKYIAITCVLICLFICSIVLVCRKIYHMDAITSQFQNVIDIVKWAMGIVETAISYLLIKNAFCSFDIKKIEDKVKPKIAKKFDIDK